MFVVTKEKLAWIDVEWTSLDEDGDQVTNSIRMKVQLVELDRFEEFLAAFAGGRTGALMIGEDEAEKPPLLLRDFVVEVTRDWDEIVDEERRAFAFTPDNLSVVIRQPNFIVGWSLSYIKAWNGKVKEREGNSGGSPDAGPGAGNRQQRRAQQSKPRRSGGRSRAK